MKDQASALRDMAARAEVGARSRDDVHALVVGGGKGGTGVSVMSVLLASAIARTGKRVLLLDATLNLGNLHVLLGCPPVHTLRTLLAGEATPQELVIPVAERLWLLPAESGAEAVHALTTMDRARLYVRLAALMDDYDVTVVDAGTGLDSVLRAALTRASRLVTVTTPDPAALADTYALIKMLSLEAPALPVDVLVNRIGEVGEGEAAWQRLERRHRPLPRPLARLVGRGRRGRAAGARGARVALAAGPGRPRRRMAKQLLESLAAVPAGERWSS